MSFQNDRVMRGIRNVLLIGVVFMIPLLANVFSVHPEEPEPTKMVTRGGKIIDTTITIEDLKKEIRETRRLIQCTKQMIQEQKKQGKL